MALSEKQKQRVDGIIEQMNDLLDKRFAQARRVNHLVGVVERDVRWHQLATLRQILEEGKSFAGNKLMVGDILSSSDENKKKALFNPEGQASIQNEIVPAEGQMQDRRSGQLEIHDVKTYYRAIEPSLEKIVGLIQSWIWWDLRDSADLYRFSAQVQRLELLRDSEIDDQMQEIYQREMGKEGTVLSKQDILKFELGRLKEIVDGFEKRRQEEPGYQMIVVSQEIDAAPEADAAIIRMAKRLMGIERLRSNQITLDDNLRQTYSGQLGIAPDQVRIEEIMALESRHAKVDRQVILDLLSSSGAQGASANYKMLKLEDMQAQMEEVFSMFGASLPAAPVSSQEPMSATGA